MARKLGLKVVYLYNVIYGVGGPNEVNTKIHGLDYLENSWTALLPAFNALIEPLPHEAVIPKSHKDGFNGARHNNYRVIFECLKQIELMNFKEEFPCL